MKLKKILAAGLSMTLAMSMVVTGSVYASEPDSVQILEREEETTGENEATEETEITGENGGGRGDRSNGDDRRDRSN